MAGAGYPASAMGPARGAEVERAVLADLAHYGVPVGGLSVDCSDPCQEGHATECLDGFLEEMPGVGVVDAVGAPVAEGWVDFVHGAPEAGRHDARWRHDPSVAVWRGAAAPAAPDS